MHAPGWIRTSDHRIRSSAGRCPRVRNLRKEFKSCPQSSTEFAGFGTNFGTEFRPHRSKLGSAQQPNVDPEPGDLWQLLISGHNQIHLWVGLRGREDQGVRHTQRLEARPEVGCLLGDSDVNRQDRGQKPSEESCDVVLVVMPEASPGQDLGVGDYRSQHSLPANELSDCRVRGAVESILSVKKADYYAGVENYRHSPRSPSTRSRKSP